MHVDTFLNHDQNSAVLCIGFTFLLIVAGVFAVSELRYSCFGVTTEARLVKIKHAPEISKTAVVVTYAFNDGSNGRLESHLFEINLPPLDRSVIPIIYLPHHPDWSEPIAARRLWIIPVFFSLLVCATLFLTFWIRKILREFPA